MAAVRRLWLREGCEPKCHKLYRRPVVELLEEPVLLPQVRAAVAKPAAKLAVAAVRLRLRLPAKAPAKAPEAAPLPAAPKADPSAAIPSRGIYQDASSLVRN